MPSDFRKSFTGAFVAKSSKDIIPRAHLCCSHCMALHFGLNFQNRSSICRLRAKFGLRLLRNLRWLWLMYHSRFAPCEFVRQSRLPSHRRFAPRTVTAFPVLSPLAGRHSHSVLGHTLSENQGFPPLSRSPAGMLSAESNARHVPCARD